MFLVLFFILLAAIQPALSAGKSMHELKTIDYEVMPAGLAPLNRKLLNQAPSTAVPAANPNLAQNPASPNPQDRHYTHAAPTDGAIQGNASMPGTSPFPSDADASEVPASGNLHAIGQSIASNRPAAVAANDSTAATTSSNVPATGNWHSISNEIASNRPNPEETESTSAMAPLGVMSPLQQSVGSTLVAQAQSDKAQTLAQTVAQAEAVNADPKVVAQAAKAAASSSAGATASAELQVLSFNGDGSSEALQSYTTAVAAAISEGGPSAEGAYGAAFAKAAAAGGDEAEALAQATATAFCFGDSQAEEFAKAFRGAVNGNHGSCMVVSRAMDIAASRCEGGVFAAPGNGTVLSRVLGICGLAYKEASQGSGSRPESQPQAQETAEPLPGMSLTGSSALAGVDPAGSGSADGSSNAGTTGAAPVVLSATGG